MITKELVDFIHKSKREGKTDEQIKEVLLQNGWLAADLEEAFGQASVHSPLPPSTDVHAGAGSRVMSHPNGHSRILLFASIFVLLLLAGGTAFYFFRDSLINFLGLGSGSFDLRENTQIEEPLAPAGGVSNSKPPKVVDENPSSTTEKLVITFPTKGAVLVEGQTYNITWTGADNSTGTYSVYLDKESSGSVRVDEGTLSTSDNSIYWTVPYLEYFGERKVLPGDGFRIFIFTPGVELENIKKYYSPEFKIVSPGYKNPIIVKHPAVGEVLTLGARYNIQWEVHTFDSANAQYSLTLVDKVGNITPIGVAVRGSEEFVNFDWIVPTDTVAKDGYVIKIQQNIPGEPAYTSSPFRIGS